MTFEHFEENERKTAKIKLSKSYLKKSKKVLDKGKKILYNISCCSLLGHIAH